MSVFALYSFIFTDVYCKVYEYQTAEKKYQVEKAKKKKQKQTKRTTNEKKIHNTPSKPANQ